MFYFISIYNQIVLFGNSGILEPLDDLICSFLPLPFPFLLHILVIIQMHTAFTAVLLVMIVLLMSNCMCQMMVNKNWEQLDGYHFEVLPCFHYFVLAHVHSLPTYLSICVSTPCACLLAQHK